MGKQYFQITVFDLETTGLVPPCQVIELGLCDVINGKITQTFTEIYDSDEESPPEVLAVHHIRKSETNGLAKFKPHRFVDCTPGADAYAAHNAAFDMQFIGESALEGKPVICTYKAALRVWPDAPRHTNQVLRYWLGIELDPALCEPVHRAAPDAYVTAHILIELMKHASVEDMVCWTKEPPKLPRLTIGKQKGAKWEDVEVGFLNWMLKQPDMDEGLKWNAKQEIARRASF